MLVALVVNRAGQTDFTCLSWNGEQTAGIDEEAVADWFLLEGHSWRDQETVKQKHIIAQMFNTWRYMVIWEESIIQIVTYSRRPTTVSVLLHWWKACYSTADKPLPQWERII